MMASPPPLPDHEARRQAATDFQRNLVVIAGAGTGKTSLLVERALNALGSGRIAATELAAITFTEKAAGEMQERLAVGLEQLHALARDAGVGASGKGEAVRVYRRLTDDGGIPPAEISRRAVEGLRQLHRMSVKTLHTFCSDLLHAHPLQAGVDPGFGVDSGEQFEVIVEEEWERFLSHELGAGGERGELWRSLLGRLSPSDLLCAARRLARFDVPLHEMEDGDPFGEADGLLGPRLTRLSADIHRVLEEAGRLTKGTEAIFRRLDTVCNLLRDEGMAACRDRLAEDSDLADGLVGKSPKRRTTDDELFGLLLEETAREGIKLAELVMSVDPPLFHDLFTALSPFVRQVRETFLARGHVSFDGLLVHARDLLRDHPQVREEIRSSLKLLLVDEFQDTDPIQYEIVLFLAEAEGGEATDPYAAALHPGRLFIVGDPKQSIYRFRGADFSAFRRAVSRIGEEGGQEVALVSNFRSVPRLLEPINHLFTGAGNWTESAYQPEYIDLQGARGDPGGSPCVEIWTVEPPGDGAVQRRRSEGEIIAGEILRLLDEEGYQPGDITLLLRAFSDLPAYLRPLRQAGIPFTADGGRSFMERPEVAHLMAALRALSRPSDPTALLAFLRSPAGGVPDTELAEYAEAGGRWDWIRSRAPEAARFPDLSRAFRLLRDLSEETAELPTDELIRRVLQRTLLLPLGAAAFEGAQRVANLRKLAAAAVGLARDGRLSLAEILDALQQQGRTEVEGDAPLADEATDAVKILTIHKAKGLENRVIIVPDLARRESQGRPGERIKVDVPTGPAGGPVLAASVNKHRNPVRVWHEIEHASHEKAEEMRVLYVALTRARDRLILLAGPPSRGKTPWLNALRAWGYDRDSPPDDGATLLGGRLLHRLLRPSGTTGARKEKELPDLSAPVESYRSAVAAARAAACPLFRSPSGIREDEIAGREADEQDTTAAVAVTPADRSPIPDDEAGALARAVGVLVHRLLEGWTDGPQADPRGQGLHSPLPALARRLAGEHLVNEAALQSQGRQVVESFLRSDLPARLEKSEILARELPLLLQSRKGPVWRGSIDLLVRQADGSLLVVDYKTDGNPVDEDLRRRYGPQMAVYAEAVRRAFALAEPPRAELWLLRTGHAVVVETAPEIARLKLDPADG